MGHTNQTANYNLPQFVGTDKPSWLGDINDAFAAIDTAIAAAATEASTADGKADALGTTVSGHTTQIGTLQNTVTSQGNTLNTVTALIGNGTPTTTDQTIIGAINELHSNQGDLDDLTTTDKSSLVAAINEVAQGGGGTGEYVEVIGDGTKTIGQLLDSLFALVDRSKITKNSCLKYVYYSTGGVEYLQISQNDNDVSGSIIFNRSIVTGSGDGFRNYCVRLKASGSRYDEVLTNATPSVTFTSKTSTVVTANDKFIVEY